MKDRPKLGRGLSDVSNYFLSHTHEKNEEPGDAFSAGKVVSSVGVCHPGSDLIQACLMANFALETAKRRHPVMIKDFSVSDEARVSSLMQSILSLDESTPGKVQVRLYGLPEITITEGGEDYGSPEDTDNKYRLVNMRGSLDFILEREGCSDYIFITKTDEKSLLRTYAFIKIVCSKGNESKFHIVFEDGPAQEDGGPIYRRFAGFIGLHVGCQIDYLGGFMQDEQLLGSIKEAKPIVLSPRPSEARDSITRICSRFLDNAMDGGIKE
jgi:hypothetical protein